MSSATAHIQKYSKNDAGRTEYFIKVFYNGKEWGIRKTYSDFTNLDQYLRRNGNIVNYELPPKKWWNRYDPNFLSQRSKVLQGYLEIMLNNTTSTENSLIKEFLEVDVNMLEIAKGQSNKELTYTDMLNNIVKETRRTMISMPNQQNALIEPKQKSGPSFLRGLSLTLSPTTLSSSSKSRSLSFLNSFTDNRRMECRSFDILPASSATHSTSISGNNYSEIVNALVDVSQKSVLEARINDIWKEHEEHILKAVCLIDTQCLPRSLVKTSDIYKILSEPLNCKVILSDILDGEIGKFMEASPRNVLALKGFRLVKHMRTAVTLGEDGLPSPSIRTRSRSSSKSSSKSPRNNSSKSSGSGSSSSRRKRDKTAADTTQLSLPTGSPSPPVSDSSCFNESSDAPILTMTPPSPSSWLSSSISPSSPFLGIALRSAKPTSDPQLGSILEETEGEGEGDELGLDIDIGTKLRLDCSSQPLSFTLPLPVPQQQQREPESPMSTLAPKLTRGKRA